ncbi:DivIVA domain-containing protein [uncultured Jatrophihabitans sp.]|uniref:DivIVA domain-containing protein n=1 Tax=uncultured Jatrophihabitans sp. TaxID=1610747 RepID=UPI0035CA46D7
MLHLVLYGLLAVLLAGVLFLLATRFLPAGEQIAPALRDEPPWELPPERMLQADDVDNLRLPVALRGYRFAETDVLLDRLAGELRRRDEELARLRTHAGGASEPTSTPGTPVTDAAFGGAAEQSTVSTEKRLEDRPDDAGRGRRG